MPLRFLADHCISNTIIRTLRDAAHEVVRLKVHSEMEHYRGKLLVVEVKRIRVRE
jgi:hypothetical protein